MRKVSKQAIKKANYKKSISSVNHIGILIGIIFAVVIANVVYTMATGIHLRSGEDVLAFNHGSGVGKEKIIANRGFIYDRNKEIIAQDIESYDLLAVIDPNRVNATDTPAYVVDFVDASNKLSGILGVEPLVLEEILNEGKTKKRYQVEFKNYGKKLNSDQKKAIEDLNLAGLEFTKSTDRVYPIDKFASQLIGYAQYNEDDKKISGVMGMENIFDKELSGKDGLLTCQTDNEGYCLPNSKKYESIPTNGKDVYLTIDKNTQLTVEKALEDTMAQAGTNAAWCIVVEAKTGRVLAQAGYPTFDLNKREEIPNYLNTPSERTFEVGSVIKAFVYAAAMNEGTYNGNATFKSGSAKVGLDANGNPVRDDTTQAPIAQIGDALGKQWGTITFDEGLIRSANTGIISLLTEGYLSPDLNIDYLRRFGFFKEVDIKGVNELNGEVRDERPGDKITVGFGQAATVNSYQIIQAATALFGDGTMIKPYVVDKIVDPNTSKVVYQGEKEVVGNPIKPEAATQIQGLMEQVVSSEIGTANAYKMSNISMMAKTGTGQIAKDGKYQAGVWTSSILAAAPAENPEIIVYYAFEGGEILNFSRDYFKDIVATSLDSLRVYNKVNQPTIDVPNPGEENYVEYQMPALVNHSLEYTNQKTEGYNVRKVVIGDGQNLIAQFPNENTTIVTNQNVFLLTDGTNITIPDMTNWSRKDVAVFANLVGLNVSYTGSGNVAVQSIPPGTVINSESVLTIELK